MKETMYMYALPGEDAQGPLTVAQLEQRWKLGKLSGNTLVTNNGKDWAPLSTVADTNKRQKLTKSTVKGKKHLLVQVLDALVLLGFIALTLQVIAWIVAGAGWLAFFPILMTGGSILSLMVASVALDRLIQISETLKNIAERIECN